MKNKTSVNVRSDVSLEYLFRHVALLVNILDLLFCFTFYGRFFINQFASFCFLFQMISECAHQTFTFDGRCFTTCPERTFIVPEKVSAGIAGSKGLSLRKRAANIDEFDNLHDIIDRTESLVKNRAIMSGSTQKLCGSCHESCLKCNGPLDSDCVLCDSNYNQIIIGSNISCALNNQTLSGSLLLKNIEHELKNYSLLKIVLVCLFVGILFVITCISIYLLRQKHKFDKNLSSERDRNFSGKYSYNQLQSEEILFTKLPNTPQLNDSDVDD